MRKVFLILSILTAVVLAGCLPQVQATPTATTQPTPTRSVVLSLPDQTALSSYSGCTVVSAKPTPGATQQSLVPPVSDTDWVKGPSSAKVTIIEYSDFQ